MTVALTRTSSDIEGPALAARTISAGYGGGLAVRDLSLEVNSGEIALLSGANGAGKTTTLMVLAGLLTPTAGSVEMSGQAAPRGLSARARSGLGLVTEHRSIFMDLTVRQNLRLSRGGVSAAVDLFPELGVRLAVRAGLLSGGEQQMLALARILTSRPTVVLADELSQGLAPIVTKRLISALRQAADEGAAILLVEQQIQTAIHMVDRVYVLRRGSLEWSGDATEYRQSATEIEGLYLE
jgi:ABC-type branched-subunit amino acid transport system ATPase component